MKDKRHSPPLTRTFVCSCISAIVDGHAKLRPLFRPCCERCSMLRWHEVCNQKLIPTPSPTNMSSLVFPQIHDIHVNGDHCAMIYVRNNTCRNSHSFFSASPTPHPRPLFPHHQHYNRDLARLRAFLPSIHSRDMERFDNPLALVFSLPPPHLQSKSARVNTTRQLIPPHYLFSHPCFSSN